MAGNEFIDPARALHAQLDEIRSTYTERDLALYALAVGAGRDPVDSVDLRLVYENHPDGFRPLSSYAVVPAVNAYMTLAAEGRNAPGLEFGLDRLLHGEQAVELLRPLAPSGTLLHRASVAAIWDKGKHATVVTHIDSFDERSGELVCRNDVTMLVKGAGGFGGQRGPSVEVNVPPARPPDAVVTEATQPNQALLYRLCGDWNPLHADPSFAALLGFDRPILHGLCTWGFAARAAITVGAGGDPRTFRRFQARFAASVFPGETLRTEVWRESATRLVLRTTALERQVAVLTHAAVDFDPTFA
jgi:(3R)-3-hydroxyacyl-CoA dehydrogenase / 3a,7a,12a-trihydroxy-5b-cholest-24-enoyl-CoA hydratase / enoyl-CoA hydratase 2